ncbi:hypothetical protein CWI42_020450 [Ordospora colligata]|nr:hypothetical protein CWI42_020450 [Ordospora colligata]
MQVSYIEKRSVDDLGVSALVEDRIFFMKGGVLVSKCIYSYDEHKMYLKINEKVDYMYYASGSLLIICGNALHRYRVFGEEVVHSSSHQLVDAPVKVFVNKGDARNEAVCFLYSNKRIEVYVNEEENGDVRMVEKVVVCSKGEVSKEDEVIDFAIDDGVSWFLARSGRIYRSYDFVVTRMVLLSKPVRMIPEPICFDGNARSIVAKGGRMYVCYEDGIEVYDVRKNVLMLNYTYKVSMYELSVFESVFCMGDELIIVEDAPVVIASVRVQKMYGNVGVTNDKILFVRCDDVIEKCQVKLLKESDVCARVDEMFKMTIGIKVEYPEIGEWSDIPERAALTAQKVVNDFESKMIDVYRGIYFELVSLNESFKEKIESLSFENEMILRKAEGLDMKKSGLVNRLQVLNERMNQVLCMIRIDGSGHKEMIQKISKTINAVKFKKHEKYSKILKMQREILNRRAEGRR